MKLDNEKPHALKAEDIYRLISEITCPFCQRGEPCEDNKALILKSVSFLQHPLE